MTTNPTETVQIDICFSGPAHMQLCSLMKRTVVTSRASVVLHSLRLFSRLRAGVLDGARVRIGQEGTESWREIDILSVSQFGRNDADDEKPYHLSIVFSGEAAALMEEMRKEMGYDHLTDVIRHILAVYDRIVTFLKREDEREGVKRKLYLVREGEATEQKDILGLS